MKKKALILIFAFILIILLINFMPKIIKAQEFPALPGKINSKTGTPENINKIKDAGDKLSDKEKRSRYLKQEWEKILTDNKYIRPIINTYKKISPFTDPIFQYTIGLTPSLNWLFFLTLIIWIAFVMYALRILDLVGMFSKIVQYIISFGVVIIISITGVTRKIAEYIINVISLFTQWWMQLIGIVIVIIIIILLSIFSKTFKEFFQSVKEQNEKTQEEINRKKLKNEVKIAENFEKGIVGNK